MADAKRHAGLDYEGEHDEYIPLPFKGTAKQKAESDAIIAKYASRHKKATTKKTPAKKKPATKKKK